MKTKRWICLGLLFLLCVPLVSCGTPEESSLPTEESGEELPAVVDENAPRARWYLEELLASEREDGDVEWLTTDRAEDIRTCVKQLKAPILTEEDVQCIAERAAAIVAREQEQSLLLPACGVLAPVVWSPTAEEGGYEAFYMALVAYTLYLFTPPDYVFRESELWGVSSSPMLYLPLAGAYTARSGALALLREGKNGVALLLSGFGNEEHPLDCALCGVSVLYKGSGEMLVMDLLEMARQADVTLPESFFASRADAYVQDWIARILGYCAGVYGNYDLPDGNDVGVYQPFSAETVQEIRERVEQLPGPVLTERMAYELEHAMQEYTEKAPLLLLPAMDGGEDVYLPPGVETVEQALWMSTQQERLKAHRATAYLFDLFTPSAYRYPNLHGMDGVCYALADREDAFVLVTEEYRSGEIDTGLQYLTAEVPSR